MIRTGNSAMSWVKMCHFMMLKPQVYLMKSKSFTSLKQQHSFISLDRSMMLTPKYFMAKKKEDKDEKKKKQKTKLKQEIGGDATQIDLNKYEGPYKRVIENYKVFLAKCRAGKLDAATFDEMQVRIGKDKLQIKQLAQIAPKTPTSVIINPYDSENLQAIQKAMKASDDTLQAVKVQKTLIVSLPNSSIQEMKSKMVQKVKKSLNEQKELLKKERHSCQEDLKKYQKIAQKDQLKIIQKQAKQLFQKYSQILQKLCKEKEKELMK